MQAADKSKSYAGERTQRPAFAPTRIEDAFGCLACTGPARSIAQMDKAVLREAARRYAASRAR